MAFSEDVNQLFAGPVDIYGKTFAVPGADPDWNSVSGFTVLGYTNKGTETEIQYSEDVYEAGQGNMASPHFRCLVGTKLTIKTSLNVISLNKLAVALGRLESDVTDKTATSPTRLQIPIGGYRSLNFRNVIIRQKYPSAAGLYTGWQLIKANINVVGGPKLSMEGHQVVDVEIQTLALASGDYADILAYPYQEYAAAAPVIDTILPASQSVGNLVVIQGRGFGNSQGASSVTFNSAKLGVTFYSWNDTTITVKIPTGAITGNVKVTVGGVDSANVSYTIV